MHSVNRILTTENRTCAIRPTAIQSTSALNALRTLMMAADSQKQNSFNVSACYVSIKLLAS